MNRGDRFIPCRPEPLAFRYKDEGGEPADLYTVPGQVAFGRLNAEPYPRWYLVTLGEGAAVDVRYIPLQELLQPPQRDFGLMAAGVPRSPRWRAVRAKHLLAHPTCEACGGGEMLQVHHCRPYHLHPDLELDPFNLITLCEVPSRLCHLAVGHSFDWKAYTPDVRMEAARRLETIRTRKYE